MFAALYALIQMVLLPILITAALVLLLRLLAGTRPWARVLCRISLYLTGIYLLLASTVLLVGNSNWALYRKYEIGLGFLGIFSVPILLEFLALLFLDRRRPKLPPAP